MIPTCYLSPPAVQEGDIQQQRRVHHADHRHGRLPPVPRHAETIHIKRQFLWQEYLNFIFPTSRSCIHPCFLHCVPAKLRRTETNYGTDWRGGLADHKQKDSNWISGKRIHGGLPNCPCRKQMRRRVWEEAGVD